MPSNVKKYSKKRKTSAKRTTVSKQIKDVVKSMNQISELKVQSLTNVYDSSPSPVQPLPLTGPLYYRNYCLGTPAANWLGPSGATGFTGLDGFQWQQGTAADRRIGKYLFLKHTTSQLRINCVSPTRYGTALQFRVIVYRAKRNSPLGTAGGNPCDDLFINNSGREIGINNNATNASRSFEYMNMIVNKKNYMVVKDEKFILQPSVQQVNGGSNLVSAFSQTYPPEKTISMELKHNSKTAFSDTTNQPLDLNYQYCVSIISAPYGNATDNSSDWRSSIRGTISCLDN